MLLVADPAAREGAERTPCDDSRPGAGGNSTFVILIEISRTRGLTPPLARMGAGDEAILLAGVVHVMTARPGRIKRSLSIDIPRPRGIDTVTSERFIEYNGMSAMNTMRIRGRECSTFPRVVFTFGSSIVPTEPGR